MHISLQDALTITLSNSTGNKLLAVVSPVDQPVLFEVATNCEFLFGKADVTAVGTEVRGFALFQVSAEE